MKKLYWQLDSNADLSVTCFTTDECLAQLEADFVSLDETEKLETQYTITPIYLTDQEYANLPEAY